MASRTEAGQAADQADSHAGASTSPRCRRLFPVEQAADHIGAPTEMLRHWIQVGRLKAIHLEGGLRIDEVELARFLQSGTRQP